jgi:hypothetical protein
MMSPTAKVLVHLSSLQQTREKKFVILTQWKITIANWSSVVNIGVYNGTTQQWFFLIIKAWYTCRQIDGLIGR